MMLKKKLSLLAIASMICISGAAQASLFHYTGNLTYDTDVVQFGFHLNNNATNVRVWTDSYNRGVNFDPITALWTDTGNLIAQNDDNRFINPATQTSWDSGFALSTLGAGDYIFTVATFPNFARGTSLTDGFQLDGSNPTPFAQLGTGSYWSVWLDGVDSVAPPSTVPEPATLALLGMGLAGLGFKRRRRT